MGCDNPGWSYWVHLNWKPAEITIRSSFIQQPSLCFEIDKLFTIGTCNLVESVSRYSGKRLFGSNGNLSLTPIQAYGLNQRKHCWKYETLRNKNHNKVQKATNAPVPKMHTEPRLDYYLNAAVGIQLHIYPVIPRVGNSITTYNNKSSTFPRMLAWTHIYVNVGP